jgi:hypothetical protein
LSLKTSQYTNSPGSDKAGERLTTLYTLAKKYNKVLTGKKVGTIFFDISKAIDEVWHKGLLAKMILLEIPYYLIKWTRNDMRAIKT